MNALPRMPEMVERPQIDPRAVWNARDLTGGNQCATIVLDGQAYLLRITRAGKLILTK